MERVYSWLQSEPTPPVVDDGAPAEVPELPTPSVSNFSAEIRTAIWDNLDPMEHKTLRGVSKLLQKDIDEGIGLNVTLYGPPEEGSRTWWVANRPNVFTNIHSALVHTFGTSDVQRNVKWIQSVKVLGLHLKHLSTVPFDPTTLLKEPDALEKLVIDVQEVNLPPVSELLNQWNNVRVLELTFQTQKAIKNCMNPMTDHWPTQGFQELLISLVSMQNLEEVSLTEKLEAENWCYRLLGLPDPEESEELPPQYPQNITALKLHQPCMRKALLQAWQSFLNANVRLLSLEVNLGLVYWEFFSTTLENNAETLRQLKLLLVNSCPPTDAELHRSGLPICAERLELDEARWFDWTRVPKSLESLSISMFESSSGPTLIPSGTRSFDTLSMDYMHVLELSYVKLCTEDLGRIFQAPHLSELSLKAWSHEVDGLDARAAEICQLASGALPLGRFNRIRLTDNCLDSAFCTQPVRDAVLDPSYSVVWQDKGTHQENPEAELNPWNSVKILLEAMEE